jgi:hypothetical protein
MRTMLQGLTLPGLPAREITISWHYLYRMGVLIWKEKSD